MAKFSEYIPILKKLEGGFANNPNDLGGPTNMGVTIATYRAYYGKDKTVEDLKNISDDEWKAIMKTYWDSVNGDKITNQSIANIVADFSVNSGTSGRKAIQKALGCTADGIFGTKTLKALNSEPLDCVFCKIRKARISFYEDIVRRKPSQIANLKGWLNRVNAFAFEI